MPASGTTLVQLYSHGVPPVVMIKLTTPAEENGYNGRYKDHETLQTNEVYLLIWEEGLGGKGVGMRGRKDSDVLITFRCEIVE